MTRGIPGVGISVFSSAAAGHSYERWQDSMKPVGHTAFLYDAQIMAAVLYHFLNDAAFRATVAKEHRILTGLFDQYLERLRQTYGADLVAGATGQ